MAADPPEAVQRTAESAFDLTGRVALVTGATRGIGLAVARALAGRGARILVTGRKQETLEPAVAELRGGGASVEGIVCHQGDPAAIERMLGRLDELGLGLDVAVINAATNPVMGPLMEIELDAWRKILDVNLTGALLTARGAARRMLARRRGSIVFMASIAGIEPMPGLGAYSVSKAGLLGLMRALARELGPGGVRVNALAPGLIETRFAQALFQDRAAYEEIISRVPLGRHGQPADVAGAAVFLASDASAYITGQALIVDGGGRV
jgi:NAD(P)-dependent dehydrogenase (short-subunit alcohol dehydrogenase family)